MGTCVIEYNGMRNRRVADGRRMLMVLLLGLVVNVMLIGACYGLHAASKHRQYHAMVMMRHAHQQGEGQLLQIQQEKQMARVQRLMGPVLRAVQHSQTMLIPLVNRVNQLASLGADRLSGIHIKSIAYDGQQVLIDGRASNALAIQRWLLAINRGHMANTCVLQLLSSTHQTSMRFDVRCRLHPSKGFH